MKPDEADREALTQLLAALTEASLHNEGVCCDGRIPRGIDARAMWAWHREDCRFRRGHAALLRLLGLAQPPLSEAEATLLESIKASEGAEIHQGDWPLAERLVSRGVITLGPARGPFKVWRRAEVV